MSQIRLFEDVPGPVKVIKDQAGRFILWLSGHGVYVASIRWNGTRLHVHKVSELYTEAVDYATFTLAQSMARRITTPSDLM